MTTETEPFEQSIKTFMFVNRKAPHGTIYALEVLEMMLISAMFDQDVHVAFMDDGVYQLKKNQAPGCMEMKEFSKTYRALEGYGLEKLYVEKESLEERGLTEDDLVISVEVIGRAQLTPMMDSMDVVLSA